MCSVFDYETIRGPESASADRILVIIDLEVERVCYAEVKVKALYGPQHAIF